LWDLFNSGLAGLAGGMEAIMYGPLDGMRRYAVGNYGWRKMFLEIGRYRGYLTHCCSVLGNTVPPILHIS